MTNEFLRIYVDRKALKVNTEAFISQIHELYPDVSVKIGSGENAALILKNPVKFQQPFIDSDKTVTVSLYPVLWKEGAGGVRFIDAVHPTGGYDLVLKFSQDAKAEFLSALARVNPIGQSVRESDYEFGIMRLDPGEGQNIFLYLPSPEDEDSSTNTIFRQTNHFCGDFIELDNAQLAVFSQL